MTRKLSESTKQRRIDLKVKRTNRVAAPSNVSSKGRKPTDSGQAGARDGVQAADKVTLSEGAREAGKVNAVEASDLDSSQGSMPDPRETSQAILEKELASVFKEIYL
jgi:hypothetical protein